MSTKLLTIGFRSAIILLASISFQLVAQAQDTLRVSSPDSLLANIDETIIDTVPKKTTSNAIDARIDYKAKDSIRFDVKSQKVYMYKENDISYEDINLKSDYMELDFSKNEVFAEGTLDSAGNPVGRPVFTKGNNTFESKSMRYNYKSEKGLINTIITKDNEGYLHGEIVKKMPNQVVNVYHGAYTTCSLEEPHFEFKFNKAKMIPDKKIVTGPAYFVVEGVPTPLFIPFGLFPNKAGQRSGVMIPTYGESANRGFYFENGGVYLAINDYLDFQLLGDIYTYGSWAVKPSMNYRKRYKYSGRFNFSYAFNVWGEPETSEFQKKKDFAVKWNHSQDSKARPNSRFSANVNIVSSSFNKFNPTSTSNYLSNTFQSSINYSTSWSGKYFLNATLAHQQNTITREINLTLPKLTFQVNRFYPFRSKESAGKKEWYENISVNYNVNTENRINTYDSLIFKEDITKKMTNGLRHSVQLSSGAIKILKHLVWTNGINYTERWYSQKHVQSWNNDTLFTGDEPIVGYVEKDTINGFSSVRDFSFTSSMSTILYGMYGFKAGPVKAIRHVLKPSISFSMRPDFGEQNWGYYGYYTNQSGNVQRYSYYDGFIYGTAPNGRQGSVGFRLSNNLEMKVRSRKDTVTGMKKVVLVEDFSLGTSYNLAADSLNLARLTMDGRTTLFKKLILNYASSFDPYALDTNSRGQQVRINKYEWQVNRRLFRPENFNWRLGLSLQLSSKKGKDKDKGKAKVKDKKIESDMGTEEEIRDVQDNLDGYVDWNIPWTLNISYNVNYTTNYSYGNTYRDYNIVKEQTFVQTLGFSGDVNITPKWKVGFRSGYDFKNNEFTYTSIDVYRDLHCWEMRFNWVPYGFRQSWNFSINIKSSLLQDLKLDKKKDYRDF
ncbi:MAG: LPS-assembly protein LptD [Chlorobi bacterium]|nr:LPS-assembly protein LptD [Chlorobiota bacterium]